MTVMQDHAALVRSTVASVLIAANTLAGNRVEEERVDGIAEGDTPRIVIFAEETAQTDSQGGTALTFDVTVNLIVQAIVEDADRATVLGKADTLTAQIKAAIFESPAFTMLIHQVPSFHITAQFKKNGALLAGDVRMQISASWRETYNPNPTTLLSMAAVTLPISNTATVTTHLIPGA